MVVQTAVYSKIIQKENCNIMEFRDLKTQYQTLKEDINDEILKVMEDGNFIMGRQVEELENDLAEYVGVKHCISCANGTDALQLSAMAIGIKNGDAVFVPNFTFFASGEIVSLLGAEPIFVDVNPRTFNIDYIKLEEKICAVLKEGRLNPKAVIAVDLFGQPADFPNIKNVAHKYGLIVIEDGAQGFGGSIEQEKACGFTEIGTTSFFPAKPLGCYGDGGAVFTNNDEWANIIKSYRVHGKGNTKYDNVRIGINSRLDTIQAAILNVKLKAFIKQELNAVNNTARVYNENLAKIKQIITPYIPEKFTSSWAQYTIRLENRMTRDKLKEYLKKNDIPSMIYYPKTMDSQSAFADFAKFKYDLETSYELCNTVLSLPMHPYLNEYDIDYVTDTIYKFFA